MTTTTTTTCLQPKFDGDLPGAGQFYCVHCTKHFIDAFALAGHLKSKVHKRRVKQLREGAYTIADAEAAAGMGSYVKRDKFDVPNIAVGVDAEVILGSPGEAVSGMEEAAG
eukprot:UC1_evm6s502